MKVLNLDSFPTGEARKLRVGGKEYVVEPMTVENFIATTKAAEAMTEQTSIVEQIEATIEMIVRSVPSIDRAVLGALKLEQLQAIVAFVRGDDVEGVETTEEGGEKK